MINMLKINHIENVDKPISTPEEIHFICYQTVFKTIIDQSIVL